MKRVLKWLKWLKVYSWENHRTKRCIAGFSQVHSWFCWWIMHFPNGKSTRNVESMVANPTLGEIALVWRGLEPICLSQFNHRRTCVWKMEVFFWGTWSRCFCFGYDSYVFWSYILEPGSLTTWVPCGNFQWLRVPMHWWFMAMCSETGISSTNKIWYNMVQPKDKVVPFF